MTEAALPPHNLEADGMRFSEPDLRQQISASRAHFRAQAADLARARDVKEQLADAMMRVADSGCVETAHAIAKDVLASVAAGRRPNDRMRGLPSERVSLFGIGGPPWGMLSIVATMPGDQGGKRLSAANQLSITVHQHPEGQDFACLCIANSASAGGLYVSMSIAALTDLIGGLTDARDRVFDHNDHMQPPIWEGG